MGLRYFSSMTQLFQWEAEENAIDFSFGKKCQFSFKSQASFTSYASAWAYEGVFIHSVHIW